MALHGFASDNLGPLLKDTRGPYGMMCLLWVLKGLMKVSFLPSQEAGGAVLPEGLLYLTEFLKDHWNDRP